MWFLVRVLLLLYVVGTEQYLLGRVGTWIPDSTAILLVFCGVKRSPKTAVKWILPLAVFRAFFHPGALLFHIWLLLVAWLVAHTTRRLFFAERWQLQFLLGVGLAWILSEAQGLLLADDGQDPLGRGMLAALVTGLVTPGLLFCFTAFESRVGPEPVFVGTGEETR
ncbi:MAG: hypothetical protein ACE5F1_05125 [Planctomycetota bacterium]